MSAAEQDAADRERPAACGLCDVGAHDPRIHVLWPADVTPEQDAALREQSAQAAREASAIATGTDTSADVAAWMTRDVSRPAPEQDDTSPASAMVLLQRGKPTDQKEAAAWEEVTGAIVERNRLRREVATVTAERDALAKRVEALRAALSFVAAPVPCTASLLREYAAKAIAVDDDKAGAS